MARRTLPADTVRRWLPCPRWGVCDAGAAARWAVALKPVQRFQRVAAPRAEAPQRQSGQPVAVEGMPGDEAHAQRRPPQVAGVPTALARGSGVRRGGDVGPRTQETAASLSAPVVARARQRPLLLTEGWHASPAALLQVVGLVSRPRRRGHVGRKPTPRLVAPQSLLYAQVVKVRPKTGQGVEGSRRVVDGGPRRFRKPWRLRQLGQTLQTACMERWDGTLRGLGAPLRPRPRGKGWLLVSLYHGVMPHQSLRHGRTPRTPALASGPTDHVWSYREYLWLPVHTDPVLTTQGNDRIARLRTPALQGQPRGRTPAPPVETGEEHEKEAASLPKAA